MKNVSGAFLLFFICVVTGAVAAGFLQAESFPGTFQDLSFQNRMDVLADGYDGFESKFDANGNCISGCPYRGISLKQMRQLTDANTSNGNNYINQTINAQNHVPDVPNLVYPEIISGPNGEMPTEPTPNVQMPARRMCKNYSNIINVNNIMPVQAPLDTNLVVTSDFGERDAPTSGASTWHAGIDLSAPMGTPVYAPAAGRVTAMPGGACGMGVEINHGGGFVTRYCHLSERVVNVGDKIQAGCHIGNVGDSGVSTGAHLHYAIIYNNQPFDPLYRENRLGRQYRMSEMSPGRPDGIILPGRI